MFVLVYLNYDYCNQIGIYSKTSLEVIQFFSNKQEGEKALTILEAAYNSHKRDVELIPHSEYLEITQEIE